MMTAWRNARSRRHINSSRAPGPAGVSLVPAPAARPECVVAGRGQDVAEGIVIGRGPERGGPMIGGLGLGRNCGSGPDDGAFGSGTGHGSFGSCVTSMVAAVVARSSAAEESAQNGPRRARYRTHHGAEAAGLRADRQRG